MGEGRIAGLLAALNFALIPSDSPRPAISATSWVGGLMLILGGLMAAGRRRRPGAAPQTPPPLGWLLVLAAGAACVGTASRRNDADGLRLRHPSVIGAVNLGFVFVALGALMTPTLTDLLLRTLELPQGAGPAGADLSAAGPVRCYVRSSTGAGGRDSRATERRGRAVQRADPAGGAGVPAVRAARIRHQHLGHNVSGRRAGLLGARAAWVMSCFWLAFLLGRVLAALLFHARYFDTACGAGDLLSAGIVSDVCAGQFGGSARPRSAGWGMVRWDCCSGRSFRH